MGIDKFYRRGAFPALSVNGVEVFGFYPTAGKTYFVWKGGNNTNGLNWKNAFTTIAGAIAAHTAFRATQTYKSVDTYIIIAPDTYEENIIALPFSCHMIGLGHIGTDKATEISPAEGIAMAGTCSGLHLYNIRFEGEGSGDICDFSILNCSIIENCQFVPKSAAMAAAISFEDCKETIIRNNRFTTGGALYCDYGIKFNGGADKYCHNTIIEDNQVVNGVKAAGTGIHIAADCCATGAVIRRNVIHLAGAGIGIDDDSDGALVYDNKVFHVGGTPYDINAALSMNNRANDNGTVTEVPDLAQY